MPAVVSDSSPLVYLARLGRFNLLRDLFGQVFIPEAVWREVAVEGAANPEGIQTKKGRSDGWMIVESVSRKTMPAALIGLGQGEQEGILLACEKKALLIIDETTGRRLAVQMGITCTGTIGVLIEAKLRGLIPQIRSELEQLKQKTNFRFTDELFTLALRKAGEER